MKTMRETVCGDIRQNGKVIGSAYSIMLPDEEAKECGCYGPELFYQEYRNGDKELRVGCAICDGYVCSTCPADGENYTYKQIRHMCDIVNEELPKVNPYFEALSADVLFLSGLM